MSHFGVNAVATSASGEYSQGKRDKGRGARPKATLTLDCCLHMELTRRRQTCLSHHFPRAFS